MSIVSVSNGHNRRYARVTYAKKYVTDEDFYYIPLIFMSDIYVLYIL